MKYSVNLKNIKQSAANLSRFLKDSGHHVPFSTILEGIAKVFFCKNWNTLEALAQKPSIETLSRIEKKIFYIAFDRDQRYLSSLIAEAAKAANCHFTLVGITCEKDRFRVEFDFPKNTDNFITLWLFMARFLRRDGCTVTEFNYWTISQHEEDLIKIFDMEKI